MSTPKFEERFIAFIDILGFKSMVEASESGSGRPIAELIALMADLGTAELKAERVGLGRSICPMSDRLTAHAGFEITQASDCAIVSTEISPAGAITILEHCWKAAMALLRKGVLIRGYVTRGSVHHAGSVFLGTGYHSAYQREQGVTAFRLDGEEVGTPFVEIDPVVQDYIRTATDSCVREMTERMTRSAGDVMAIFPFRRLSHSFAIAGQGVRFDPAKEKAANAQMREHIRACRDAIANQPGAATEPVARKIRHYLAALDAQLALADRTDQMIDSLRGSVAPTWTPD